MSEPTIICPNCKTEIKLTESLAAPLIESTRREYEKRLAQKDADVAKRDAALREREEALSKAQQTIDDKFSVSSKRSSNSPGLGRSFGLPVRGSQTGRSLGRAFCWRIARNHTMRHTESLTCLSEHRQATTRVGDRT